MGEAAKETRHDAVMCVVSATLYRHSVRVGCSRNLVTPAMVDHGARSPSRAMETCPPKTPTRTRRKFTTEIEAAAVCPACYPGANVCQVARDLETGDTLIRNLIRDAATRRG